MKRITEFSIKNGAAVVIVAVLLLVGGLWSASQLKQETMPDVNIPVVTVVTVLPGASPQDVQEQVADPMTKAVQGVAGVQDVTGQSSDSVSVVVAEFGFDQDMDKAEADIKKTIESVELPDTAAAPEVGRFSFGSAPIVRLAITAPEADEEALRTATRDSVIPALNGVDGVAEATLVNDSTGSVLITLDADKLREKGLTAQNVVQQLQAANMSFPVGAVDVGETSEPVRVSGTFETVDDLKSIKIAVQPNTGEIFGDAFAQVGEGMGQLGSAVGQLGQGVGQLGSAVGQLGQGMGQLGSAVGELGQGLGTVSKELGTQIGLVSALQDVQVQLLDAKIAKAEAQTVLADPNASPQAKAQAQAAMGQLSGAIAGLEQAASKIEKQLKAAQEEAQKQAQAGGTPSAPPVAAPSGVPSGLSAPACGSGATASVDAPEVELETVALSEVATVEYTPGSKVVTGRADGKPAMLVSVVKTQDANTVDVSEGVATVMAEQQSELPAGAESLTLYDASRGIEASISGMVREGLLGALFAFLVILLFLRNWRATIISAVSIPLSVLTSLALLNFFDVTLNVMTLGGLTVAIGRVVDDSIVVIENIFRHFQEGSPRTIQTIVTATSEVSAAITSSTLTTVAVFLPLGLVTGIVGKIFQPFALTVAIALLASLAVAVTIVPLMSSWLLRNAKIKHVEEGSSAAARRYRSVLGWSLDHKWVVALGAIGLFVASLALVPFIGTGFVPETKEKYVNIELTYPEGTKQSVTGEAADEVEAVLKRQEGVALYQTQLGSEGTFDINQGTLGPNKAAMFVRLDSEADTDEVVGALQDEFEPLQTDGAEITISRISAAGSNNTLDVTISGGTFEQNKAAATQVAAAIADVDGLENARSNVGTERKQVAVSVDQDKAAVEGVNTAMVAGTVRSFVAHEPVGTMKLDGHTVDITYGLKLDEVDTAGDLKKLELDTMAGERTTLGAVAEVEEVEAPVSVLTKDGTEYAAVSGVITARDSGAVVNEVKARLDELALPPELTVQVGGTAEMMNESFQQLGMAMLVAVFAVYLVMVITFGEATAPLAILVSLPLALIGGLLGLFVMGLPIDMPAMIGGLMLIGIVVTNAIVLVELVQQKRQAGVPMREALLDAGQTRMRPILMTALSTIMALLPLASGFAEGALISQGLAVIVIGGLTSSTMLTLLVVPVAFEGLENLKSSVLSFRLPWGRATRRTADAGTAPSADLATHESE